MNDAALVGLFEPLRYLLRDGDGFIDGDRSAPQALREVLAFHQFHGQEVRGGSVWKCCALEAVDMRDVRVIERSEKPGLTPEASQSLLAAAIGRVKVG